MLTFIILLLSAIFAVYLWATRNFNYWKDRGVKYIKPTLFVGNLGPIFTLKCSIGEFLQEIYTNYKDEPYVGIFMADKPCLVVKDFALVNRILKQDFYYFNNRMLTISRKTDPVAFRSLFSIHGKEWKNTRARLSPIFTTNKQKAVFDRIVGVGEKLETYLSTRTSIGLKEVSCGFTVDCIADAAFGLDGKAMLDPENDIMSKLGHRMFDESISQALRSNTLILAPEIMEAFNIALLPDSVYDVIKGIVKGVLKMKENPENRKGDYIDALIDSRKKGPWEGNDGEIIVPDDENLVGQFFMFFTAGFGTTASAFIFCFMEIALNPEIQEKLRQEIEDVMADNDDKITYESIHQLPYLTNFLDECMRKNPPFPFVDRVCSTDYQIPGTDIIINKGTKIMIPVGGLQNDEMYYENPDVIIPERFDESMQDKPYFPFSMGPRTCIGMKFAMMMLKISIISTIRKYQLTLSDNTPKKIRMSPKRFGNIPLTEVYLNLTPLSQ